MLDQSARQRDSARMVDKLDHYEALREISSMLDSFEVSEQRQIMAWLAERYKMKLVEKAPGSSSGYRPNYKRKTRPG